MFCIKTTVASLVNNWQAQNQYWLSNMIFYSATQHQFLKLFIKILKWVYEKILNKSVIIFNSKVLPWSVLFWQLSTSILEAYLCIMARVLLFKTHITTAVESACRVVSIRLAISRDFFFNLPARLVWATGRQAKPDELAHYDCILHIIRSIQA